MEEKARENRLRRKGGRLGIIIKKSRARNWSIDNRGGYMLIDAETNCVIDGSKFELDLDGVESGLDSLEKKYIAEGK